MKKSLQTSTKKKIAEPRIFKMLIRDDAHEVGLVVAYPVADKEGEAKVKAQLKKFPNETEKLTYLSKAHKKGFRNFENTKGKIDTENMVLSELARRQAAERKEVTLV